DNGELLSEGGVPGIVALFVVLEYIIRRRPSTGTTVVWGGIVVLALLVTGMVRIESLVRYVVAVGITFHLELGPEIVALMLLQAVFELRVGLLSAFALRRSLTVREMVTTYFLLLVLELGLPGASLEEFWKWGDALAMGALIFRACTAEGKTGAGLLLMALMTQQDVVTVHHGLVCFLSVASACSVWRLLKGHREQKGLTWVVPLAGLLGGEGSGIRLLAFWELSAHRGRR
nr:non-structural protein NS2a [Tick-borne encephalitis virus]